MGNKHARNNDGGSSSVGSLKERDFDQMVFTQENLLGSGASGAVYKVRVGNRFVAVKKLLSEKDFKTEMEMMLMLDSPFLVKQLGFYCNKGEHWIATEFMQMGDLDKLLAQHPSGLDSVLLMKLASDILQGLNYLHSNGIIHRDLKPGNILLSLEGASLAAKIGDFGISRLISGEKTMTGEKGTSHYMAPEIINQEKTYDQKVDVFSFSMMFFEMLFGEHEMRKLPGVKAMFAIIQNQRPEFPKGNSKCSPEMEALIKRGWDADPNVRPYCAEILALMQKNDTPTPVSSPPLNNSSTKKDMPTPVSPPMKKNTAKDIPNEVDNRPKGDKVYNFDWQLFQKAQRELQKEAAFGSGNAKIALQAMKEYGMLQQSTSNDGFSRLDYAASHGDTSAQLTLAYFYYFGHIVAKDWGKSSVLYQLVADRGNAIAQCGLGCAYSSGEGVEKDERKAATLFQLAADQGYARAQNNLADCYERGIGVPKDLSNAASLYQRAADQGDAIAKSNFGAMFLDGRGVFKDEKRAAELFRDPAELGEMCAQANLANLYAEGNGVKKDLKKAAALFQKSADQGLAYAQYKLGVMYEEGRGVKKDMAMATALYRLAATQGSDAAKKKLGLE